MDELPAGRPPRPWPSRRPWTRTSSLPAPCEPARSGPELVAPRLGEAAVPALSPARARRPPRRRASGRGWGGLRSSPRRAPPRLAPPGPRAITPCSGGRRAFLRRPPRLAPPGRAPSLLAPAASARLLAAAAVDAGRGRRRRGCWRGWVGRWRARGRGQARHGRGAARRGDAPMGQGPATAGRRGRAVAARCATRGACSHGAQRRTGGETRISQRLASRPASFRAVRPIWPDG